MVEHFPDMEDELVRFHQRVPFYEDECDTKIKIEIPDEAMILALKEFAELQLWTINSTIQDIIEKGEKKTFQLVDLQDCFSRLQAANEVLEDFGGERIEIIAFDAKVHNSEQKEESVNTKALLQEISDLQEKIRELQEVNRVLEAEVKYRDDDSDRWGLGGR